MRTTRRRPETEQAKLQFVADHNYDKSFTEEHRFDSTKEVIVRAFEYWIIIENKFPYDLVLSTNHMLVPKRIFGYLSEATDAELAEYDTIIKTLDQEGVYESMMENFTKGRSVRRHVHIHLMVWKHEKDIVGQPIEWNNYPQLT